LESQGVVSYLFDENSAGINSRHNIITGVIKLKINEFDIEKVKLILEEINLFKKEEKAAQTCSRCKSENVMNDYKSMKGIKGFMNVIMCSIFPTYYMSQYKCNACDIEFRAK
jgi:hypothetical protein